MRKILYLILGFFIFIILLGILKFDILLNLYNSSISKNNLTQLSLKTTVKKQEEIIKKTPNKESGEVEIFKNKTDGIGETVKKEKICGYLVNPTPGNWWINDSRGEWDISFQGNYWLDESSVDNIPDISESNDYIMTNGSYGYGCACLDVLVSYEKHKILKIFSGKNLAMTVCKSDKSLNGGDYTEKEKGEENKKESINLLREKSKKELKKHIKNLKENKLKVKKDKIYFSAFPDFGGSEDEVSYQKIKDFENLIGRKIFWAYFSQNWNEARKFPKSEIEEIRKAGAVPFVRLMLRGTLDQTCSDKEFSLDKILAGKFDKDFSEWAQEARKDGKMILVEFGVEQNGDWFQWSGFCNGKNPEKFKQAYRRIIDIFRDAGAYNITWFFHTDIESVPKEGWNKQKNYYPGDDYIDWIGISAYGPQNEKEAYWEKFSDLIRKNKNDILEISKNKPLALLEFGVSDGNKRRGKAEWLRDAFETILNGKYLKFSAVNYWHENWEERGGVYARLRVDSSPESLGIFKEYSKNKKLFPTVKIFNKNTTSFAKPERKIRSFYNQAYIENYQADKKTNLFQVENSYILINSEDFSKSEVLRLRDENNLIGCYTSVGTAEKWRDDFNLLKNNRTEKEWSDWDGEYFISKIDQNLISLMKKRIDRMAELKCNFVEFDNMDWADGENIKKYNLKIGEEKAKNYVKNLCRYAHQKGLKCMAKSTTHDSSLFDGLTVESYTDDKNWWSEAEMKQVLRAGKIGAVVHYDEENCDKIKEFYENKYGKNLLFICEDKKFKKYRHF